MALCIACKQEDEAPTPPTIPTTPDPLTTIEQAILAANIGNYTQANRLLDITNLATLGPYANNEAYWQWLTSEGDVQQIEVQLEENVPPTKRIFVVMHNNNSPQQQTGFWVHWKDDKWVATVEQP